MDDYLKLGEDMQELMPGNRTRMGLTHLYNNDVMYRAVQYCWYGSGVVPG